MKEEAWPPTSHFNTPCSIFDIPVPDSAAGAAARVGPPARFCEPRLNKCGQLAPS